jgi:erythromycin esterase-like protein
MNARERDALLARAAGARMVLVGEPSHGTYDFYRERAELTKRLIAEHGFTAVAIEADWPDAYRVNRYVRGIGDDETPEQALGDFVRFPSWMWRNVVVDEFVGWLRDHNDALTPQRPKTGFYGLDLYSIHASMDAVVQYLERIDPDAAQRARERYACFDEGVDLQAYGALAELGGVEPCQRGAVEQLLELQQQRAARAAADDALAVDGHFYAEQNARLVVAAEAYYRAAFRGGVESWNLRDAHMADMLDALLAHLQGTDAREAREVRVVVWAHNSHVGDARATHMATFGELSLGQLVRERQGRQALLIGGTTYTGTVTAASGWGGVAERMHVRPALEGSWEAWFHQQDEPVLLTDAERLDGKRLERAIGVVYRPQTERTSHYFDARLSRQFDVVLHLDDTRAVEPLERTSEWEVGELPETYPWGV